MNKVYVLDTTVLIDNPRLVYDLKGLIAVPITVLRQLDGLKKSVNTDVATKARRASRILDEITARGDPVTGITMPNGSVFKLARKYTPIDTLDNIADNKIVGTAEALKKEAANTDSVTVLTTDVNMRIAARGYGVKAEGDCEGKALYCTSNAENEMPSKVEILIGMCIMLFLVAIGFVFFSPDLPMKYLGVTQAQAIALIIGCGVVAIIIAAITMRSYRSVKKRAYEDSIYAKAHTELGDTIHDPAYSSLHGNIYHDND
ncbi:MAG: PIN domain-containing protein [Nitrospirota bacterium]